MMTGIKGKRVPGRPGRFDPNIPLHMTTRRKAARQVPDAHMDVDEEYDDADSRRTSLDDISVTTPQSDFEVERPAKRRRTGDHSHSPEQNTMSLLDPNNLPTGDSRNSSGMFGMGNPVANGSQSSSGDAFFPQADIDISQDSNDPRLRDDDDPGNTQTSSGPALAAEGDAESAGPGSQPDETQADEQHHEYEGFNDTQLTNDSPGITTQAVTVNTHMHTNDNYQSGDEGNWTETVEPGQSAQQFEIRAASEESSKSDAQVARDLRMPEVSTDATPMATRQGSPDTTASAAAGELTPARSKPTGAYGLNGSFDDEEADEEGDDEGEPATQVHDSTEIMEEEVEATQYPEEYFEEYDAQKAKPTKMRRFAGGRRRAAHSNAYVEAALRRQLELKQFYRQVTRSMKSCLGELAQITLDELETDPHHHEQVAEYEEVMAELDAQLARRKQQLLSAQKLNHQQLQQRYEAESESRKNRCRNLLEDIKEQQLVNLEYNMLQVNRAQLREEANPGHETEDEDGVIPRPKRASYRFKRHNAIDLRYDSRSRFTMETERRVEDLQYRTKMWEALQAFDPQAAEGFTVMDIAAREAAEERRRNVDITDRLAAAAAEFDRMTNPPMPPQPAPLPTAEELAPLNALAELATRPALRSKRKNMASSSLIASRSPRQSAKSPLPSQTLFDRSTSSATPRPLQSPFLRVAVDQTGSAAAPDHQSARPFSSSNARHSNSVPPQPPIMDAHDSEETSSLLAQPASHAYSEHTQSTHDTPSVNTVYDATMNPERRALLEAAANGERWSKEEADLARNEDAEVPDLTDHSKPSRAFSPRRSLDSHSASSSKNGESNRRHSHKPSKGYRVTKAEYRKGMSRRQSSRAQHEQRQARPRAATIDVSPTHRRDDHHGRPSPNETIRDGMTHEQLVQDGIRRAQEMTRDPSSRTTEELAQDGLRRAHEMLRRPDGKSHEELIQEGIRRAREIGSQRDHIEARDRAQAVRDNETRRMAADLQQSGFFNHRRMSAESAGARFPGYQQPPFPPFPPGPMGPPPAFYPGHPMPPPAWAQSPYYGQPPMPAPTAQPVNHFAMQQGHPGASWPYPHQTPPPPPPGSFRDTFGRR